MADQTKTLAFVGVALAVSGAVWLLLKRRRRQRRTWQRRWLSRRDLTDQGSNSLLRFYRELLDDGDNEELRKTLRMPLEIYRELLQLLRPNITKANTNWRKSVSAETRLALTMRYLALGDSFLTLSQAFRVGLSTSRAIVADTCDAICSTMSDEYMKTPTTREEWLSVAADFEDCWNMPHCIGAADGKHVRIVRPPGSGSRFFNYKRYYSVILMAVASARYEFLYIDVGAEGRASDGGVWAKTPLLANLEDPTNPVNIPEPTSTVDGMHYPLPYFMVGDDAFKLTPYMLKPYSAAGLRPRERIFNYRLSRARRVVENAFGILSVRFRLLRRSIELHPHYVDKVIYSMCILHNYLIRKCGKSYLQNQVDREVHGVVVPGDWREEEPLQPLQPARNRNPQLMAKEMREQLTQYFLTPHGELPWQYELV